METDAKLVSDNEEESEKKGGDEKTVKKQKMKTNLDNNNCIEKNVKIKDKGIKLI